MNKQHKNKWMGIATSLSLVLALVLSSNVFAGPGKGPKSSIKVLSICTVDTWPPENAKLIVKTKISDASSSSAAVPYILENGIKAVLGTRNNKRGDKWMVTALVRDEEKVDSNDTPPVGTVDGSVEFTSTFSLCDDPSTKNANAARIDLTIKIQGGHKTWFSHCDDDPMTEAVEGSVPIGGLGICAD